MCAYRVLRSELKGTKGVRVREKADERATRRSGIESGDTTRTVARFVSEFDVNDLSDAAVSTVKLGIFDCIGVGLAGSAHPAGRIAAEFARNQGAGPCSVWGHQFSTVPALAALANGTAAHALDYDDVNWAMFGHPSAGLVAATIAVAEQLGSTGAALIEAYACGFEVLGKVGRSCMPDMSHEGGWHTAGVIGPIGTAAAVSRLLGLDEDGSRNAIGIAVSEASGVVRNFGTMTKPLHAGLAAQAGVQAAGLARSGFTASPDALEGEHGWYSCFARGLAVDLDVLDELGEVYELERTGLLIKPYPCGVAGHPAIDAALILRDRLSTDEIASITSIEIGATSYTIDKMRYAWPENELQAKFSVPYQTARTLLAGRPTLADFQPGAMSDQPDVRTLAEKVHLYLDDRIEAGWRARGGSRPCRVTIHLGDGRTEEELVEISKGNPEAPLTTEEVRFKFRDSASLALNSDSIERASKLLETLEDLADVRVLGQLLRGS
jgi:2-methylcitrate dehydratase PrpD